MALFENVIETCRKKGINVTDLERRAGLPDNTIYKWRSHVPAVDKVLRVARALGVSMDQLMKEKET